MCLVSTRIEKKAEERHQEILRRLEFLETKVNGIEMRLTRLEARFDERGYWESREYHKTGIEDKK